LSDLDFKSNPSLDFIWIYQYLELFFIDLLLAALSKKENILAVANTSSKLFFGLTTHRGYSEIRAATEERVIASQMLHCVRCGPRLKRTGAKI
jgi:hypothetical protein